MDEVLSVGERSTGLITRVRRVAQFIGNHYLVSLINVVGMPLAAPTDQFAIAVILASLGTETLRGILPNHREEFISHLAGIFGPGSIQSKEQRAANRAMAADTTSADAKEKQKQARELMAQMRSELSGNN